MSALILAALPRPVYHRELPTMVCQSRCHTRSNAVAQCSKVVSLLPINQSPGIMNCTPGGHPVRLLSREGDVFQLLLPVLRWYRSVARHSRSDPGISQLSVIGLSHATLDRSTAPSRRVLALFCQSGSKTFSAEGATGAHPRAVLIGTLRKSQCVKCSGPSSSITSSPLSALSPWCDFASCAMSTATPRDFSGA